MHKHLDLPKAFADLGVEVRFLKALAKMGFKEPSEIQRAMIPIALEGRDILGQARTGTGKTAAFGLPVLQQVHMDEGLQAICLAPTRELAIQVTAELRRLSEFAGLHVVAIYGGQRIATQLHELGRKPHVVVGTPGRVQDFINRGNLNIAQVRAVMLDEVDRMLDIGFRDDIRRILSNVKSKHQTILVSATIDDEIKRLSGRYMTDPVELDVSRDQMTVDEVDQYYVTAESRDKFRLLKIILQQEDSPISIVFCNTKAMVRRLAQRLHEAGFEAQGIVGDLPQHKRDQVMRRFRSHQSRVLVATDLASRGLDIGAITHIINYDIPPDPQVYVHRIGRTARMGSHGVAVTMVSHHEGKELTNVERLINREVPQRDIEGYKCSEPQEREREREQRAARPEPVSRFQAPVFSDAKATDIKMPRKTLGSRFRPSRKRRL